MKLERKHGMILIITVCSALVSYALNHYLKLGPVIAASIVGLAAGFLFKEATFAVASYSASFMGMCSLAVAPSTYCLIPAGLINGLVVILLEKTFVGYGGKAGTMAFISIVINSLILWFLTPVSYIDLKALAALTGTSVTFWVAAVISGVLGIMLTMALREKAAGGPKGNDAVVGSATIALLGAVIVPSIPFEFSSKLPAIIASGSYAGMVSRKLLPKNYDLVVVGVLLGILNVLLAPIFPGFGGKLGTIGLISMAIWLLFIRGRGGKAGS